MSMAKKTCAKCEAMKEEEDFPFRNKAKNQRSYWCKVCHKDYREDWLITHPNYNKKHYAKYKEIRKIHIRKLVISPNISNLITEALLKHVLEKGYKLDNKIKPLIQDVLDISVFNAIDDITKRAISILDNKQRNYRIWHQPTTRKQKALNKADEVFKRARKNEKLPEPHTKDGLWIRNKKQAKAGKGSNAWHPEIEEIAIHYDFPKVFDIS